MIAFILSLLLITNSITINEKVVLTAQSSVGTIGGKVYQKYTGTPGQPWCVSYAVYTVNTASKALPIGGKLLPKTAYSLGLYTWAKKQKLITKTPSEGDVAIWRRKSNRNRGHVGIVESIDEANNTVYTIEGNSWSAKSRSITSKNVVRRVSRSYSGKEKSLILLGYIDIKKLYEQKYGPQFSLEDLLGLTINDK